MTTTPAASRRGRRSRRVAATAPAEPSCRVESFPVGSDVVSQVTTFKPADQRDPDNRWEVRLDRLPRLESTPVELPECRHDNKEYVRPAGALALMDYRREILLIPEVAEGTRDRQQKPLFIDGLLPASELYRANRHWCTELGTIGVGVRAWRAHELPIQLVPRPWTERLDAMPVEISCSHTNHGVLVVSVAERGSLDLEIAVAGANLRYLRLDPVVLDNYSIVRLRLPYGGGSP